MIPIESCIKPDNKSTSVNNLNYSRRVAFEKGVSAFGNQKFHSAKKRNEWPTINYSAKVAQ